MVEGVCKESADKVPGTESPAVAIVSLAALPVPAVAVSSFAFPAEVFSVSVIALKSE